jgi:hypothetical protein
MPGPRSRKTKAATPEQESPKAATPEQESPKAATPEQEISITEFITRALKEADEKPVSQIKAVVEALGEETSLALLAEVEQIENSGGMPLPDGSRRRTPGGVFFRLARRKLSHDDRVRIFPPTQAPPPPKPKQPIAPPPSTRPRIIDVASLDVPPPRSGWTAPREQAGAAKARGRVERRELMDADSEETPATERGSRELEPAQARAIAEEVLQRFGGGRGGDLSQLAALLREKLAGYGARDRARVLSALLIEALLES